MPNSRLEDTNHTLFQTKMVETDTLFQTKKGEKNIPFGPPHIHIAYIRDYPSPPPHPGEKNASQITSLAAYASETNKANPEKI